MSMRRRAIPVLFALLAFVHRSAAHAASVEGDPGDAWCARAEGATYSDAPGVEITIEYADGAAPEGCLCLALESPVRAWLDEHHTGAVVVLEETVLRLELGPANPLVDGLLATRDAIYEAAMRACIELVPATASANTCRDPARFDVIPSTRRLEPREIYRGSACIRPRGAARDPPLS